MRPRHLLLLGTLACGSAAIGPVDGSKAESPRLDAGPSPAPPLDAGSTPPRTDAGPDVDAGHTPLPDAGHPLDAGWACVKPTASNTGVPPGMTLQKITGDLTLNKAGVVTSAVEVSGEVTITADNVTLQNARVHGGVHMGANAHHATLDHCDIGPDSGGYDGAQDLVGDHSFVLLASNLHNFPLGVRPQSDVVMRGNYLHAPYTSSSLPPGGVAGYGVSAPGGITLDCNNLDLTAPAPGSTQSTANAVFEVTCTDDEQPPQGLTLTNNWFGGGGYAVYIWGTWGTVHVDGNRWDGRAAYGPVWVNSDSLLTTWTDDAYLDGGVIQKPSSFGGVNCKG